MNTEQSPASVAIEVFSKVASSCEVLRTVEGQYLTFISEGPPMLVALQLIFENNTILVSALGDDSILVVANQNVPMMDQHIIQQLNGAPWADAIGKSLLWAWVMVNQQGYFDGIQLDFSESSGSNSSRFQLLCVASELIVQPPQSL